MMYTSQEKAISQQKIKRRWWQ